MDILPFKKKERELEKRQLLITEIKCIAYDRMGDRDCLEGIFDSGMHLSIQPPLKLASCMTHTYTPIQVNFKQLMMHT